MDGRFEKEKILKAKPGMPVLIGILVLYALGILMIILGASGVENEGGALYVVLLVLGILIAVFGWIPAVGLKIVKPQEALVLTLFGKYMGTLKEEGYYFVNPFSSAINPAAKGSMGTDSEGNVTQAKLSVEGETVAVNLGSKAISLKAMTLNNNRQKINDKLGNPIEIGVVVIWRVVDTAKAVFNVDNFKTFLSIQCDSALRNIARLYPYDLADDGEEMSLRGSSNEVADRLKEEIQSRVDVAGLEIAEARITHLAYAPEIAAAMLQRQQASAVIDARKMIVDGAVGMVEDALNKLAEKNVVELDEERKAQMVSNLLVVLCSNRDPQPVVNSGSIY